MGEEAVVECPSYPEREPDLTSEAPECSFLSIVAKPSLHGKIFPILHLPGEIRNQIYRHIIGPEISRDLRPRQNLRRDRKFNTALCVLNRQINQEFSDVLWDVLSVEWKIETYILDREELRLFTSMERLQRCKLVVDANDIEYSSWALREGWDHRSSCRHFESRVEDTVFGLARKLNLMPQLTELHLEYEANEDLCCERYFVRLEDGRLRRYDTSDIKMTFKAHLRGMKKVHISGNLCDKWTAMLAYAVKLPK